jgi:Protein of unknown function (DUF2709)
MTYASISDDHINELIKFLSDNPKADLISVYLNFLEKKFNVEPVLFPREKTIFESLDFLIAKLESEQKLWRETEITIQFGKQSVNEETKKIYICPFTGKVFGDNTHPNPQDAIYDWVSKCPENTERAGGLKVKRFLVSEDPEVIKNYIKERKAPVKKVVFSSAVTGKLFNSRKAVIDDFKKHQVKIMTLLEVQSQNKYTIEQTLLDFLQKHLTEEKISTFIEALSEHSEFQPYLKKWLK